jgi:hypothetical protein
MLCAALFGCVPSTKGGLERLGTPLYPGSGVCFSFLFFFLSFFLWTGGELGKKNVWEKAVRDAAITHPRYLSIFVNECMDMFQREKKKRKKGSIQVNSIQCVKGKVIR